MKTLFIVAVFLSATLLFMVQPLVAKILLPVLGGSPAVWSTCLVFYQTALLLGYLYAHALSTGVPPRWQRAVHIALLVAAVFMLPIPIAVGEPGSGDPRVWLVRVLAGSIGVPLIALCATSPLLQHWFSRGPHAEAKDPYFLYAASNAGSLLGLLGYLIIEPVATRSLQARAWSLAFVIAAVLVAVCGYAGGLRAVLHTERAAKRSADPRPPISFSQRASWVVFAAVPSALLIGVTQHLTTDVVSVPLLWVVPLAVYLSTCIAAFSGRTIGTAERWGSIAGIVTLMVMIVLLAELRYPIVSVALVHLSAFTVLAMLCHTQLAESRPDSVHVTAYYVHIALGGVLGGAAVTLAAPSAFPLVLEYPIAIAAAILLRPQTAEADSMATPTVGRWAWRAGAVVLCAAGFWSVLAVNDGTSLSPPVSRLILAIPAALLLAARRTAVLFAGTAAGLLMGASVVRTGGEPLYRERTFFGVHEVTALQNGAWHVLTHGTTTHGIQATGAKARALPTAYYHPTGPLGDVVFSLARDGRLRDIGAIGLGAGALAAYAGKGVRIDFFEVDETVIRIAENPSYFTYLTDAKSRPDTTVRTIAVDGRLGLAAMPPASYDLIVVDAFSSDAIPTHLITREAVQLFLSRLKARGLLTFHVSSRFFNLPPVLATIAEDQGLACYVRDDKDLPPERLAEGKRPSVWVVLARTPEDMGQIAQSGQRWVNLSGDAGTGGLLWTDDYTNPLDILQN